VSNLSPHIVLVCDDFVPEGATVGPVRTGESISLAAPASLLSSGRRSSIEEEGPGLEQLWEDELYRLRRQRKETAVVVQERGFVHGAPLPPPAHSEAALPLLTFMVTIGTTGSSTGDSGDLVDGLNQYFASTDSEQVLSACSSAAQCRGAGGDPLYLVTNEDTSRQDGDSSPAGGVYCAVCCLVLCAAHPGLRATVLPGKVLAPAWLPLFDSGPTASQLLPVSSDAEMVAWQADFGPLHMMLPALVSGEQEAEAAARHAEVQKAEQDAVAAVRRSWLTDELASRRRREASLAAEVSDLEAKASESESTASAAADTKQDIMRAAELGALAGTVDTLRSEAVSLRERFELEASVVRAARVQATEAGAGAKAAHAEEEARGKAAARRGRGDRQRARGSATAEASPGSHVTMRHAATVLEPPTRVERLDNHRRLLNLLREGGHGLLFRTDYVDVFVTVHRPTENLIRDRRAPASGLWARLDIHLEVRRLPGNRKGGTGGRASFRLSCLEFDVAALHLELLPPTVTEASPAGGVFQQSVEVELIEIICQPPTVCATVSSNAGSPTRDAKVSSPQPDVETTCTVTLPLSIATFLRPLPESTSFGEIWDAAGLKVASLSVSLLLPAALEPGTLPAVAAAASGSMAAALALGGVVRTFQLAGGQLGLGAELPAHGCVEESHAVLVRVAPGASGSARAAAVWELAGRSVEQRLADALIAALATQLRCLPQDAPGQAGGSRATQGPT